MVSKPAVAATYVSLSMFSLRNVVCTSSWRPSKFSTAMAITIRMLCSLKTGLKIPPQSTPGTTFARQAQAKLSRPTDRVNGLMIQVVYYYLPAGVGTAEVTPFVTTYTLRCQDSHNLQYASIPNRYETVKLKRHNEY